MSKNITPYKGSDKSKKEQVADMFDSISENYDGLNRALSFGIDQSWRRKVVKLVSAVNPKKILDIATGTGDLAIMLNKTGADSIIGLDITEGMLNVGKKKIKKLGLDNKIKMVVGDSEDIPYDDNSFDAVTVSFGVRNFENLDKGLSEIHRVLKPNGIFVVLETAVPSRFPFKQYYKFHTSVILPFIGKFFSKDDIAYDYLAESANSFPHGKEFNDILNKNKFSDVHNKPVTFGVSSIYTAKK